MPLLSTLGSAGAQGYGTTGIQFGGSALFNAAGDRFQFPVSTAFNYGTGNFTIEMWIYPTSFADYRMLWKQDTNTYLYTNINTGQLYFFYGQGIVIITTNAATLNAWNHVAVVRTGNSIRIFLNGVAYAPATITRTFINPNITPLIGHWLVNDFRFQFLGNITNVRISKQSLYAINFTPSSTPFTRTSQGSSTTSLLMNMRNAVTLSTDSSTSALTVTNNALTFDTLTPYRVPFVVPPNTVVVSALVTPSTTTPREGDTITVNVVGTNTANGTYFYSLQEELEISALTAGDFTSGSLNGSFNINSNQGSFTITITADLLTEGAETFDIYVRTTSTSGPIIGISEDITITDSSLTPLFTVEPGSINEGDTETFTVANVGANGTYFFTVLNGTTANADFTTTSGSFVVSGSTGGLDNGTGSFDITTVADRTTEGAQTFQVQVRSGSVSGTVVVTSASQTIVDSSLLPFINIVSNFNIAELSGGSAGFSNSATIEASNLGNSGTYFYTILNLNTTNADFSATSGSFTTSVPNGIGTFTVTAVPDAVIELDSPGEFQVQVRTGSTSGPVIGTSGFLRLWDSSLGITVTPNPASEGNGFDITVFTSGSSNGLVTGQYFLTFESTGSATAGDVGGLPFAFNVPTGGNYFLNGVVAVTSLDGAEPAETFRIGVRQGTSTGTLVGLSSIITINASAT